VLFGNIALCGLDFEVIPKSADRKMLLWWHTTCFRRLTAARRKRTENDRDDKNRQSFSGYTCNPNFRPKILLQFVFY